MDALIAILKSLYGALYHSLRDAQGTGGLTALAVMSGLSFAYGVLHILLPGHQKAVISAYFLSENARYGQGLLVGLLFAVIHAISAVLLPLILRLILKMTMSGVTQFTGRQMQLFAVVGITLMAALLFAWKLKEVPELRRLAHLTRVRRELGFDLHDRLETAYEPIPWKRLLPFIFFAALLPCPDTIIFMASLAVGAWGPGLAAVLAMSLGMALTLTIIALVVIVSKRSGRALARGSQGWVGVFTIEMAALVVLVLFALLLLGGATGPYG
jgi:ABC-type nickel/cobalt efflux system permease component RcnA